MYFGFYFIYIKVLHSDWSEESIGLQWCGFFVYVRFE